MNRASFNIMKLAQFENYYLTSLIEEWPAFKVNEKDDNKKLLKMAI